MSRLIYLDHNASTPVAAEVVAAMAPFTTEHFGNPHTTHWAGRPGGEAIVRARAQVAELLGCSPAEIVFTGGATEANNHAIKGVFFANRQRGDHFVSTRIEHPSVKAALGYLERRFGATTTYVGVDRFGRVDPAEFEAAITPRTLLISVMHANNETGTVQPVAEIGRIARRRGVLFHTDAAQSVGKLAVRVDELGVDLLSVAGHKMYAPKGIGALYVRQRGRATPIEMDSLIHGAGQEDGRRGGTENVAYIVGLGAACALCGRLEVMVRVRELRDYFWERLRASFGERVALHGHPDERLPNTLNVGFRGAVGAEILSGLEGVAATTGAACHAGETKLSETLEAMGVDEESGRGAVRWSLGRGTTREELEVVVERLRGVVSDRRQGT